MENLIRKVRPAVHGMISPGEKVLAAVSGGPDSVALLNILLTLKEEIGYDLVIGHLNHRARGPESEEDALFVLRLGAELGLETFVERKDVLKEKERLKTSFQEAARILRYEFFETVLKRTGGNKIALGHTADDQAETVLMHLLRGSGLRGLSGIPPVRGPYIRPLLECPRKEILQYLESNQLDFKTDSSNQSAKYLRNRIRHELIPQLETYNRRIREHLVVTAKIIREDDAFIAGKVKALMRELRVAHEREDAVILDIKRFAEQTTAIQNRLIRRIVMDLKGDLRRVTSRHVNAALRLAEPNLRRKQIDLPGNITVLREGPFIKFVKTPDQGSRIINLRSTVEKPVELRVPGEIRLEKAGLTLKAALLPGQEFDPQELRKEAYFDAEKVGNPVLVRCFKPGDRFKPLGMKGTKKIKSFFIDQKIPREQRPNIPILTTVGGDIIWVYGLRISEPYKVRPETKTILSLKGLGTSVP